MISEHWFRQWLDGVRQQAITWRNVNSDICHHMASLGHSEYLSGDGCCWSGIPAPRHQRPQCLSTPIHRLGFFVCLSQRRLRPWEVEISTQNFDLITRHFDILLRHFELVNRLFGPWNPALSFDNSNSGRIPLFRYVLSLVIFLYETQLNYYWRCYINNSGRPNRICHQRHIWDSLPQRHTANSLSLGKCVFYYKFVNFKHILVIHLWSIQINITLE